MLSCQWFGMRFVPLPYLEKEAEGSVPFGFRHAECSMEWEEQTLAQSEGLDKALSLPLHCLLWFRGFFDGQSVTTEHRFDRCRRRRRRRGEESHPQRRPHRRPARHAPQSQMGLRQGRIQAERSTDPANTLTPDAKPCSAIPKCTSSSNSSVGLASRELSFSMR